MEIRPYSHYCESEILPLYKAVGWRNYYERPQVLKRAYENSLCVLGAFEQGRLVGIIRAVGDGCSIVFVQDVIVHPDFQRWGIGTKLMRSLLERYENVYQIQLLTDDTEATAAFYKSLGFRPVNEVGCCGFIKWGET